MAKTSIKAELLAATGLKEKAKEDRQALLKRIHVAVQGLSDEDWKALSGPAARWSNEASGAYDGDKPLPDFPDAEPAAAPKGKASKAPAEDEDPGTSDGDDAADDETEADEPKGEGESEDKPVSTKTKKAAPAAAKPAKKAATTKETKAPAAKKKAAPAAAKGDGYKGHRAGSRKAQVHEVYDTRGKEAAKKKAEALGIQANTASGWISSWGPSGADKAKPKAKPKAKAKK